MIFLNALEKSLAFCRIDTIFIDMKLTRHYLQTLDAIDDITDIAIENGSKDPQFLQECGKIAKRRVYELLRTMMEIDSE